LALTRKCEANLFVGSCVVVEDDEVVAVRGGGVVAPDDLGHQQVVFLGNCQLLAQYGAHSLLEGRVVLAVFGSIAPLVAKEGGEVEVLGDLVD
jgi:predicted RNA-binding protein